MKVLLEAIVLAAPTRSGGRFFSEWAIVVAKARRAYGR